ncbi:non-hydrolyzing UDP-N-acetylglucosamine 2-epimerase [Helicobacter turcicus]|uniref:UDP-N-acetylglucosamine 2-epimerase (Non-hydrolyzing) n=1 Tax=Helicobacter turcicus TaxID=2867412 RepID=A0ABS7JQ56_9HELI|nr:UDP-N-acetylglucosamine 2-epimerase (non-hydrolyzing) [Helicobacter turcicus]MBX7546361.1 UDP-N-acetylglucosamine 2-epimerase (non-hydrolyzing) [Helicobacter turcicus]
MKKIVSIVGARPQFIKAAAFSRAVAKDGGVQEVMVHTGQHYDTQMSASFFKELEIPTPAYHLGIGGLSHGAMTGRMLERIEEVLVKEKPDFTLIYGDTDSTLAGALASAKLHIPIAHVEAGLRSFNPKMPEEINRILSDRISKFLFVPSQNAYDNLVKEGFLGFDCALLKVGDIMLDVALHYQKMAKKPTIALPKHFILCTLHRAENTDDLQRMQEILEGLNTISKEVLVCVPLHPRTRNVLEKNSFKVENLRFMEALSYLEMVWVLQHCQMVITDSGGLQKEAYFFKKPCMTLRDETEWVELVECGVNVLVGANRDKILDGFKKIADMDMEFEKNLYGNGDASKKILQTLKGF